MLAVTANILLLYIRSVDIRDTRDVTLRWNCVYRNSAIVLIMHCCYDACQNVRICGLVTDGITKTFCRVKK